VFIDGDERVLVAAVRARELFEVDVQGAGLGARLATTGVRGGLDAGGRAVEARGLDRGAEVFGAVLGRVRPDWFGRTSALMSQKRASMPCSFHSCLTERSENLKSYETDTADSASSDDEPDPALRCEECADNPDERLFSRVLKFLPHFWACIVTGMLLGLDPMDRELLDDDVQLMFVVKDCVEVRRAPCLPAWLWWTRCAGG
jgi:hypothetical protein